MPRVIEPPEQLLDLIYDAASDEALWTDALGQIADMTDSVGGFLFGFEAKERLVTFTFNACISEESHRIYRERHFLNLWSEYMNHSPVGELVRSDEIAPLGELQRTAFFDEVLRPQGIGHSAMLPLAARGDFGAGFNICRGERQGPFEADDLAFFSKIYPHLRRALLLGFRLDGYKALQRAAFQVLDRLSAGIVLLDRAGRVGYANDAANAMAADGGPLRLRNIGITTASASHAPHFERLIQAALGAMPLATMSLPHPQDGRLFTVLASSIRSRDVDRFNESGVHDAAAMLIITDPLRPFDIPIDWIIQAYGVTRAEAKVALAATSGASISEIAQRLNVSPNTVKTHLRSVFAKTGVSGQGELAKLVTSLAVLQTNGSSQANGS